MRSMGIRYIRVHGNHCWKGKAWLSTETKCTKQTQNCLFVWSSSVVSFVWLISWNISKTESKAISFCALFVQLRLQKKLFPQRFSHLCPLRETGNLHSAIDHRSQWARDHWLMSGMIFNDFRKFGTWARHILNRLVTDLPQNLRTREALVVKFGTGGEQSANQPILTCPWILGPEPQSKYLNKVSKVSRRQGCRTHNSPSPLFVPSGTKIRGHFHFWRDCAWARLCFVYILDRVVPLWPSLQNSQRAQRHVAHVDRSLVRRESVLVCLSNVWFSTLDLVRMTLVFEAWSVSRAIPMTTTIVLERGTVTVSGLTPQFRVHWFWWRRTSLVFTEGVRNQCVACQEESQTLIFIGGDLCTRAHTNTHTHTHTHRENTRTEHTHTKERTGCLIAGATRTPHMKDVLSSLCKVKIYPWQPFHAIQNWIVSFGSKLVPYLQWSLVCSRRILIATSQTVLLAANPVGAVVGGILTDKWALCLPGGNSQWKMCRPSQVCTAGWCLEFCPSPKVCVLFPQRKAVSCTCLSEHLLVDHKRYTVLTRTRVDLAGLAEDRWRCFFLWRRLPWECCRSSLQI